MFKDVDFKILKNILIETTEKYDKILNNYSSLNYELKLIKERDTITNVLSKQGFIEGLSTILNRAEKENKKVYVIIVNLDNFKYINDVYGHGLGDIFLNHIALILVDETQNLSGLVGRIGGDSFAIAVFDLDKSSVISLTEKILDRISDFNIKVGKTNIKTTASAGISVFPIYGKNVDELITQAEQAMYISKNKGRDTLTFYNEEIGKNFVFVEKYKTVLNFAVKNKSVIPYVQPIYDIKKGKIIGGEVLLRIKYDSRILPAGEFISVAERFGFIDDLESILIEKMSDSKFLEVFKGKYLFLNKTIKNANKAKKFKNDIEILLSLKEEDIYPVVEITESSFVEFFKILTDFISFSRKKGIKIALDDFGAGYASFSYLLNLDLDLLKIDGTLIKNIKRNRKSMSIVKAISQIAYDFGIKTIAEYVENKEILDEIEKIGITYAQGYYISKPVYYLKFKKIDR